MWGVITVTAFITSAGWLFVLVLLLEGARQRHEKSVRQHQDLVISLQARVNALKAELARRKT